MILLMLSLGAGACAVGYGMGRLHGRSEISRLRAEMESLHDPELLRMADLRRQMQQEQRAFNLLCNYGTELAYGQVSAADMMERGDRA